jgi:hypothetical protein
LQDLRIAELGVVAARVVDAVVDPVVDPIAREDVRDAAVPTFLLRCYLSNEGFSTDGVDVRDALGVALAQALALAGGDATVIGRAAWLTLLVEATAVAEDERMLPAAAELIAGLEAEWPAQTRIDEASASVEACLRAAEIVDPEPLVQDAIDQLERVIGGSYRPGDGLVRERDGIRLRCSFDDHVRGASALLTAFELTGRLPYSMLAEELMVIARRERPPDADLVIQCEAARVLCRLAALHDDPGYRGAAVIATGADYRADASRILAAQSARALAGSLAHAAAYGLALLDLLK